MTEPYTYALLRYYHDIAGGECVNVGVAVFAPTKQFLRIRCAATASRVARMFPDVSAKALQGALRAIEVGFATLEARIKSSPRSEFSQATIMELAKSVLPIDDSSLKWGASGSGLTDDPPQELDRLFQRMVQRYNIPPVSTAPSIAAFMTSPLEGQREQFFSASDFTCAVCRSPSQLFVTNPSSQAPFGPEGMAFANQYAAAVACATWQTLLPTFSDQLALTGVPRTIPDTPLSLVGPAPMPTKQR